MDPAELEAWYADYLAVFAALGRGDRDDREALLRFFGVPLLVSTGDASTTLATRDDVLAMIGAQVAGMRAARYDRSEPLGAEWTALNATCSRLTARFVRRRADGSEIGRIEATYLVTEGPGGRRMAALVLHG